jgi:predicted ATPase/class 3 adenylate cyclase
VSREERKVITVLFTDLVGFTSRAEELDPEDVRAMLSPYYARLREQIEQRGGTVEKFIGDAVMAVFGAPVAHEDDPLRAVLTALAIRDAVRESSPDLQIRTAVNTGEALVALDADPGAGEAMASGDVVNTAARLQSSAPVDGILVGEATYRATRHLIEYRETEPVTAKGKAAPIAVWEALAAHSRLGVDVEQVRRSALVGRERELAVLTDALSRCRDEHTAQLVTLVGVPGIGKSRLVTELLWAVDKQPDVYWWKQGRSLPYGESQSFWALGEIVKAQAGILDTDDGRVAAEKLATMVEEAVPEDERAWVESHVRPLAGVATEADEGGDRRAEVFSAWRRLFEALAEQRPLVLVFEDLHWADDGLLDFVDHLAEWVSGVPMLLVGTARPELLERRPGWGGGKRNATTLSIGSLSEEETARLLGSLLDQTLLPAEVQAQVLHRAEGNPLYAEEYVRMLQDRGFLVRGASGWQLERSEELPLPETVQGMIAARLDALTPSEKELVQDAAVLGKVFWPSAIESADAAALHALERKEFIRRDRRSSVAGETQYAFLHLLVRNVAYGQIPRARRVEKHRAAAEWIESLALDRSEERAEMLAHHYREALALAEAAGVDPAPFRAPARAALVEASERAAALSSWRAAEELARSALELTDPHDPSQPEPELQLRVGRATAFEGRPEPEQVLAARDGFLARGALERAGECEALLGWMFSWRGQGEEAMQHTLRGLELVADQPTTVAKARAVSQAARRIAISGDRERGMEIAQEALALAEELGHDELASNALNSLGLTRSRLGDIRGLADLERSIELADRSKAPDEIVKSRNNLATQYLLLGRIDEAEDLFAQSREAAVRLGVGAGVLWADMEVIAIRGLRGDFAGSLAAAEHLLATSTGSDHVQNAAHMMRAWVSAAQGRFDEALPESEAALARAREVEDPQHLGPCLLSRVFVLAASGRGRETDPLVDELLSVPELTSPVALGDGALLFAELGREADYRALVDQAHTGEWKRAAIAIVSGDFGEAAAVYAAMGTRFFEAWARLLAAEHGETGQLEAARAYFAAEHALPFLQRCEALLSASA